MELADGLGACLRRGIEEPGGRRGMGIRASFRGCEEWLVRRRVRGKGRPSWTVGGALKEMVRPEPEPEPELVLREDGGAVREVGRLSWRDGGGGEDEGWGKGRLLGRLGRGRVWDDGL